MNSLVSLFFVIIFSFGCAEQINTEHAISIWAEYAYNWFMLQNCTELNNTAEETCYLMKKTEKHNYRIYGVEPVADNKVGAVFPDGELKHKVFHDGIIVLDPFPMSRFGHPILVFNVEILKENMKCDGTKGFTFANNYCLYPLTRTHCNRHGHKYAHRSRVNSAAGPNCGEIIFLPLVHLQSEAAVQGNDRLKCFSNIEGFNRSCPHLRAKAVSTRVTCHPFLTNDENCGFYENRSGSRCSNSQTCDHAVLLSGGWNRQLSDESTFDNIMNVKRQLMVHGFLESNIEVFYANGPVNSRKKYNFDSSDRNDSNQDESDGSDDTETETYFSSSLKSAMRNHIRTVCDAEYCADTLLIYMNSPTKFDGSSLLWDIFDNGVYGDDELYTPKELFRDIARCKANRVVVLADQNYGGALVTAAEARFNTLQNVVILTAAEEFIHNGMKDRITAQLLREKYYDVCLNDFRNVINKSFRPAEFIGYKQNLLNFTLVGAPCTAKATSLSDPDMKKYRGCELAPIV